MIWFCCKQCGKKHGRPDNQVGSMIFCDCGFGLRVPWASTIPEPEASTEAIPVPAGPLPAETLPPPRAIPVPVDEPDRPRLPSIPVPANPPSASPPRRQRRYRKVDPGFCLNHDETAVSQACADCRLPFCADCLASLGGAMLCGPCKNFRLRSQTRLPRVAPMAVVGLVLALASSPVAGCISVMAFSSYLRPNGAIAQTIVLALLGMLFPAGAMVLSGLALRSIDGKPNLGGRGMALTGMVTGLVGILWNMVIGVLVILKQVQG